MVNKLTRILKNKIALIPLLGSILIIISFFTPFALSKGKTGISISSQSDVWFWGFYQAQDQIFILDIPFRLNVVLSMIVLFFAISVLVLSIQYGLNTIKRKLYGELIFICIVFIFLSTTLIIKLIEYTFSLMPDLEPVLFSYASFWGYRLHGVGYVGINVAIFLVTIGSLISLRESRKKGLICLEIIFIFYWLFYISTNSVFLIF